MDLKKALFVCLLFYYGTSANSALPEHSSMSGKTNMSEQAKGIRISGTITDKDKNPLPGVNVRVLEQTGTGVITDMDGLLFECTRKEFCNRDFVYWLQNSTNKSWK